MKRRMKSLSFILMSPALALIAGCARTAPARSASPPQTVTLTAVLLSPSDIQLTWHDAAPNTAGHVVEFATEPQGEFTTLGFFPPEQNTFTHPNLMPETNWYYRVRPYYGPASNEVELALPGTLSDKEYAVRFNRAEDFSWAQPQTIADGASGAKLPIRSAESPAKAAPTDLKATWVKSTVSGFLLTWSDHSSDEDGYLLEMKMPQDPAFSVRAVVDRGINSFGYALQPPERQATFRVRAFFYGQPSNLAHATTGEAPAPKSDTQTKPTHPAKH